MSKNHEDTYIGKRVICPFYRSCDKTSVLCEGPEDGMLVRLIYQTAQERREAMLQMCCTWEYGKCRIAHIAQDRYDEEQGRK